MLKDLIAYDQKSYQKFKKRCLIYNNDNSFIQRIEGSYKIRKTEGYKRMSEDELLKAFEESEQPKPPKTIKEIRKKNYDSDKIIRDSRALYESDEDYYEPKR